MKNTYGYLLPNLDMLWNYSPISFCLSYKTWTTLRNLNLLTIQDTFTVFSYYSNELLRFLIPLPLHLCYHFILMKILHHVLSKPHPSIIHTLFCSFSSTSD